MKTKAPKSKLIPLQVKLRPDAREKLQLIAARNGLSLNDVASMSLAAGLNMVDRKLQEIHEEPAAA